MAIIKCKMCGGDLILEENSSTATCEYCGGVQTVPKADDEKKLLQFERAEKLRKQCEFDKAAGIYETIVADFREEAEAYWGLVLCKFGIEYVDDPATGKKVPTCHRSSFDSILEDSDFEQALENADLTARRVYRDEAKAIEEIRKGIIEVSSNEQPYDIFICYKETAEDGQRTLDSVLAQDVYDALTDKGYRVFFSRITLEDKLGVEYEPYIFAALNSAKVMLTFGTDYEYFNAVWVKNEWSRFLKLMAKDKDKHLIPCYKGIDAYDMPKEFAKLQAQDLGKVGAMQDLLRGIEKLLPRQTEPQTIIQERVVVGGSGDNKIASLLDRGNMALEDGDWAKADSFFEDVLNNDSKNAQAYLGKTLAQEKCRTIDAFARKRKDATQAVRGQQLTLEPDRKHISEKEKQFSIPGYAEPDAIRKLYDYDLSYHSDVAERQSQYRNEEAYWANHKWMSKAEKFATGAVAANLAAEKKALFAALTVRVKKAQDAEAAAKAALEQRYAQHLRQADEKAEALFESGIKRREERYQSLLEIAKTASAVPLLTTAAEGFELLGSYQDSKNLAQHCRNRAAEEQAKLDKAEELRRIQAEKAAQEKRQKIKRLAIAGSILAAVVILIVILFNTVFLPPMNYNKAVKLLETGNTVEAAIAFGKAGNHKDAATQSRVLWDQIAHRNTICADFETAVALKADGTVVVAGKSQGDLSGWEQCIAVANNSNKILALKEDGTVYCTDSNKTSGWKDIVAISADSHYLGLRSDGTVVATGANSRKQCQVSGWKNIVAIAAGGGHSVGLRADGTVVAVGDNDCGQCNVTSWKNIVAIAAGYDHTVGLCADGTVVATKYIIDGEEYRNQCEVSGWSDIVAISAGSYYTVGLHSDGTVVSTKNPLSGYADACKVENMMGIAAIAAGSYDTLGLRPDGTIDHVGSGARGSTIESWTDIKTPQLTQEGLNKIENAILEADYLQAVSLLEKGPDYYTQAKELFSQLGSYRDSAQQLDQINTMQYNEALELLNSGYSAEACEAFKALDYKDSAEKAQEAYYQNLIVWFGNTTFDSLTELNNNKETYRLVTGDEIKSVIAGNWIEKSRYIGHYYTWDVTLDDHGGGVDNKPSNPQAPYVRSWMIVGDLLHYESHRDNYKIDISESFYAFEVRELTDGIFILYNTSTNPNTGGSAEQLLIPGDSIWADRLLKELERTQS